MARGTNIENAYALIIGISEYKDPKIPKLNFTHADAEGIFRLLTDPKNLGLSKDKIRILLDEDATQFKIKNAITSWLYNNAEKDSIVIIFFAGHGHAEEDKTGIEKDNLIKYLLPYDTVIEDIYNSAISNRDFHELLLTIKSRKLVIFMDSCYSGGVSGGSRDVIPMITEDPYEKLAEGEGRIVIAASQPNQLSFENAELGHGVFTYNLLEALSGKADLDNDGYVTVLDTYKYLQDAVPRDSMKLAGGKQDPILRGDITKDFVISIDRERFEEIADQKVLEEKLRILETFYDEGKFSGKQYEYLRALLKLDPNELKDKNKKIVKRINDLLSGNISIPTFLENMERLEPELFGISENNRQDQERLSRQKEEERIQREKALKEEEERKSKEKQLEKDRRDIVLREKADTEVKLKTQKEAEQPEQEPREQEERQTELSALYWKGIEALEEAQDWQTAIKYFNDLLSLDAGYRDAQAKLKEAEEMKKREDQERVGGEKKEIDSGERKERNHKIVLIWKWGSMIVSLLLIVVFWIIRFNQFIYNYIINYYWPIPLIIYLMYKERTAKIKYGRVWYFFPISALALDMGWAYPKLLIVFFICVIPAIIIDLYALRKISNDKR